jgi:nucleolar protein 53
MSTGRPQQKKQPSRKGKKAWRKNVDVDDIEEGLEERREEIRQFGEAAEDLDHDQLFTVDVSGDANLKKKAVKPYKVTKSAEILAQRSKAAGFNSYHKKNDNKIDGVKKKEIHRLMKLAGRVQGESQVKTIVEKEGIITTKAYDVWGDEPASKKSKKNQPKPEVLEKFSSAGWTTAKHVPSTISHAPLKVKDFEVLPHAGKSYNPSLESWKSLIQREFKNESEKEQKRLELEEHKVKIQHLIETLEDKEEETDDEAVEEEEEEEQEDESESLSLNRPVALKKKTKYQRNRAKRHQERVALEKELKDLKRHIHELEKLPIYEKQVIEHTPKNENFDYEKELVAKRHKLGSKHAVEDNMVEVKLSDELTDSLRKLKAEGNLFYDHMRSMQSRGKIETRKPVKQKRKYNPKITEKWTYKDFK